MDNRIEQVKKVTRKSYNAEAIQYTGKNRQQIDDFVGKIFTFAIADVLEITNAGGVLHKSEWLVKEYGVYHIYADNVFQNNFTLYSEPQVCPKPEQMKEQMQVAADFGYSKALTEIRQYCIDKRRELTAEIGHTQLTKPHENQSIINFGAKKKAYQTVIDKINGCPACIPVPSTPASEGMLLTDEEIKRAWWDCYGEELPATHGLVFGRAVRSRQLAKATPLIEAPLRAEIERLNKEANHYLEVGTKLEARIKELEEQNEQLRIGELVIVTEQKQKEQIIAETKAPLMAKIKELEVKTGSCRGCDQFFSTQISEAKAEARREAQEVYMPYIKLLGDELDGLVGIATVHGWKSTKYEEGVKCREAIAKLNGVMPEEGK